MVFVISKAGKQLMPTTEYRARKLLGKGKAEIYKYRPFTIQLTEREDGDVQPIEYACDTGYQHIGISIKSAHHEYVNEQRDLLKDKNKGMSTVAIGKVYGLSNKTIARYLE